MAAAACACGAETDPPSDAGAGAAGAGGSDGGAIDCYGCHGDEDNGNNAPPPMLGLPDAGPDPHQSHLQPSDWRATLPCDACHVVPAAPTDPGHNDTVLPAEVTWGERASAQEAQPSYDPTARGCQGVYCHGATLPAGAVDIAPGWDDPLDPAAACGTRCHESPPAPPHPVSSKCGDCHSAVADTAGAIVTPELHIDGVTQVDDIACSFCHGEPSGPDEALGWAPPLDTLGNEETTASGVGAHQQHLTPSDWHAPAGCEQCHAVPATVVTDGHIDEERPADLSWGALARESFADPSYANGRCAGTYCHGATLIGGGNATEPLWTLVDGTQTTCDGCHGAPPVSAYHPYVRDPATCSPCHAYTGHLPNQPATHIDGLVTLVNPLECNYCHGNDENDAPPTDCSGQSDPSLVTVGAHQSVVGDNDSTDPLGCAACHVEPTYWIAMGHRDGSPPAEVIFGALAKTGGREPFWNGTTCAGTYCHDSNPLDTNPSKIPAPTWTTLDGTQATCDACHGYPPWTATHPLDPACGNCHSAVVGLDHLTIIDKSLHLDGLEQDDGG